MIQMLAPPPSPSHEESPLEIDPAPDLAIEVEVSRSALDKLDIYAGLGVRELWRIREDLRCDFLQLDERGTYRRIDASVSVPGLNSDVLAEYLKLREQLGHTDAIRHFEERLHSRHPR
jgi:hypothetical protein